MDLFIHLPTVTYLAEPTVVPRQVLVLLHAHPPTLPLVHILLIAVEYVLVVLVQQIIIAVPEVIQHQRHRIAEEAPLEVHTVPALVAHLSVVAQVAAVAVQEVVVQEVVV